MSDDTDYGDSSDAWDFGYEEGCHETMYYCYAWLGLIFAIGAWARSVAVAHMMRQARCDYCGFLAGPGSGETCKGCHA